MRWVLAFQTGRILCLLLSLLTYPSTRHQLHSSSVLQWWRRPSYNGVFIISPCPTVARSMQCARAALPAGKTDLVPAETFASAASKKSLHGLLPPKRMRSISCDLNASIVILRTKLMCTPSPRWTPAQLKQMKTPNLGEAHCGEGAPQSQQRSFPLDFWISRSCGTR